MIILIDLNSKQGYYSKTLAGLNQFTGRSAKTLNRWLKSPEIALKQGYIITLGIQGLSKQGGKR